MGGYGGTAVYGTPYLPPTKMFTTTDNSSVIAEMSFLLLGLLLLHICNGVSSKQSGLEEAVKDDPTEMVVKNENGFEDKFKELMQRMERMDINWKLEKAHLETKLETQNVEMGNLQKQFEEMKVQFGNKDKEAAALKKQVKENENKMDEMMKNQNQEVANSEMKMECEDEVKKEVAKVLPTAVKQGLRDLPFEMVCAYKYDYTETEGTVNYDRISVEFNNTDRPGGLFFQIYSHNIHQVAMDQ